MSKEDAYMLVICATSVDRSYHSTFERVDVLRVILNDRNKLSSQPNVEHYVINEARVTHGWSSSDLVSRLMKGIKKKGGGKSSNEGEEELVLELGRGDVAG